MLEYNAWRMIADSIVEHNPVLVTQPPQDLRALEVWLHAWAHYTYQTLPRSLPPVYRDLTGFSTAVIRDNIPKLAPMVMTAIRDYGYYADREVTQNV